MAVLTATALTGITTRMADASMAAGSIIQVESYTKTDSFTTTSSSWTDTGLTDNITTTGSNKVLVLCQMSLSSNDQRFVYVNLLRGSTEIYKGDSAGSYRVSSSSMIFTNHYSNRLSGVQLQVPLMFVDSPGAGTHTYKVQMKTQGSTDGLACMGQSSRDTDNSGGYDSRHPSTITLMEVAA